MLLLVLKRMAVVELRPVVPSVDCRNLALCDSSLVSSYYLPAPCLTNDGHWKLSVVVSGQFLVLAKGSLKEKGMYTGTCWFEGPFSQGSLIPVPFGSYCFAIAERDENFAEQVLEP